ncbi:MAG TPA: autotransporter domain-containing protein [Luteimonas sp.]|nr:autotransporter domain-containing protein [Luteimonas sp.]
MRPARAALLLTAALLLAGPLPAFAQSGWTGAVSSDWYDAGNWTAGVPDAADNVNIDTLTPNPAVISGGNAFASWLLVGQLSQGQLTINNGGTLTSVQSRIGNNLGVAGAVTVSGAGSTWNPGFDFLIGVDGSGSLTVADGGTVNSTGRSRLGFSAGAQGDVTVAGAGSTWNHSGDLVIGIAGDGELSIEDGGAVTTGSVVLGSEDDSLGSATVAGAGSSWNTGSLIAGQFGNGAVRVSDGGTLSSTFTVLGNGVGGGGGNIVTGAGSAWNTTGAFIIGNQGMASLVITTDGTVTSTAGAIIGNDGGQGSVSVLGPGSAWNVNGGLTVGAAGTGYFELLGGALFADSVDVGEAAGSGVGSVTLRGDGSDATISNELVVGDGGTGTLLIDSGGTMRAGGIVLGRQAGAQGTLTVSDPESVLTHTGTFSEFVIGLDGSGTLAITAGGTVDGAGDAILGAGSGSGEATVTGAGAQWLVDGLLVVGANGSGTLSVEEGGRVEAGRLDVGNNPGGTGTATVDGGGSVVQLQALGIATGGSGSLEITGGGLVESALGVAVGAGVSDSVGAITVTGTGSRLSAGGTSYVGYNRGEGRVDVLAGGVVDAAETSIGHTQDAQGTINVSGAGSRWRNSGLLTVGNNAGGSLAVDEGGVVESGEGRLGETAAGLGTVTLDGAGSSWTIGGSLAIGAAGTGTLAAGNGASVGAGQVAVGRDAGSEGTLALATGSTATSGTVDIGTGGTGTLRIESGATLDSSGGPQSRIGAEAGANGTVAVTGAGSQWTLDHALIVGRSGTGAMTVSDGGRVAGALGVVGDLAGAQGTSTITGAGSRWNNSGVLYVGNFGQGAMTIADGGSVTSTVGSLGGGADATGTVAVTGAGSNWTLGDALNVGNFGSAELAIADDGMVVADTARLGLSAGGTGAVTVAGDGSRLQVDAGLVVGSGGNGSLAIADGGVVASGDVVVLAEQAGSTGILNLGAAAGEAAADAGTLDAAQLQFGAGAGTINFNHTGTGYVFDTAIGGTGTIEHLAGTTSLTGAGDAGGSANVRGGTLLVEGSLGDMATTVFDGATLGGSGAIGGDVAVLDGGILAPGSSAGTLSLGSLSLSSGSILDYELGQAGVVGGGVNDLIEVAGDLTLDGTLQVTDIGGFGAGVYRLVNYGGMLTDNGLELGALPVGSEAHDLFVQTAIDGQVNLVNSAGLVLSFWDGAVAGEHNNGAIDDGDGSWNAGNDNWTASDGALNGRWDDGTFAVFGGVGGNVEVVGEQAVAGMQFMSGYTLSAGTGGALRIDGAESVIRVDPDVTATIAAGIAGSGGLVKTDTGTLVLSGENTYAGGTRIDRGTLSVSADSNLGAASGALSFDSGTLRNTAAFASARGATLLAGGGTFETGADLTLSGSVDGAGALTKTGAGTLTLTGGNTYAGGTRVLAGTLVGDADAIRGDLANDGTVVLDQVTDAGFAGDITGTGAMAKRGAGALTLAGDSVLDWSIEAGTLVAQASRFAGDAAIADGAVFRFTDASGSYGGVLSGAGRFEIAGGASPFVLAGNSIGFAGATALDSGTLRIDGSLGGLVTVAGGAVLTGTGTLGSVDNAGTLAPGNSIGTLNLTGDYVHRDGAVFEAEIEPGGGSDLLDVAGSATIDGGSVQVIKLPGQYEGGTRYTLIDAAGGVSGTFDTLDQDLPFLDLLLGYDANHVYLDVQRNDVGFDIVCGDGTFNQCQVAGALDRIAGGEPSDDLQAALAEVTTMDLPDAQAAFDRLSGEAHGSLAGILLEGHALYGQAVSRRIADRREATGAERLRGGAWVRAYGASSDLDGDGNAHAADFEQRGLAVGFDAWGGERWLVGASFNALRIDADFRPGDRGEADAKNASLYASLQGDRAYLDAVTSFAWWDNDITRRIEVGDIAREARSGYGGHRFATHLEAGWTFALGRAQRLTPLVGVDYAKLDQEGFREEGAQDLDLIGRSQDVERTTASAGLRWETAFDSGEWTFEPTLQARWLRALGDEHAELAVAFAGAPDIGYRVRGVSWPGDRGLLGVGLQVRRGDDLDLFVDLDYQKGGGLEAKSLGAGLRWRW